MHGSGHVLKVVPHNQLNVTNIGASQGSGIFRVVLRAASNHLCCIVCKKFVVCNNSTGTQRVKTKFNDNICMAINHSGDHQLGSLPAQFPDTQ